MCGDEQMTKKRQTSIWSPVPQKCSLTRKHTPARTKQPSSMGMPLDMILACSKHASWNRGLLAFGLPSASNKLSQPDPSEVPSALEAESAKERARDEMKREQVGIGETGWKGNNTFQT